MAQAQAPKTGEKRGPGRPPRTSTPAVKKQKIAAPTPPSLASPVPRSPAVDSPAPEKKGPRLPAKVVDSKPLPSLREPQSLSLSSDEYQSIAASAVLPASLERSRQRWIHDGIFHRYWVKPEQTKAGKPPSKPLPPNNPDGKLHKHKGECRIRIEPHMLVAEVYVEEKGKPPPPPKQYVQNHGQPYRAPQQPYQHAQPNQNRILPPPVQNGNALPPLQQQRPPSQAAPSPVSAQQQDKKAQPDPVISMLANRASSDTELKALMKEVATGNATQDQLKIFQKHIDELTAIIQKQKKDEEDRAAREQQQANMIQYDGAADMKPHPPAQHPIQPHQPQHSQQPRQPYPVPQPPAPNYQNQQPTWTPPPPTNMPVLLQFTTQGACEDRFLFPQYSILESLSPQHLLVSFMLLREGREAVDTTGLELDKEYWTPITMMIEVAYGREEIMNCIRRWCKPAEEVRKWMEDSMKRCQRAPESYLALRLPFKSTAATESEDVSKEATPVVAEKLKAKKSAVKSVKKTATTPASKTATPDNKEESITVGSAVNAPAKEAAASTAVAEAVALKKEDGAPQVGDAVQPDAIESGRPRRATRKSVRISEG